MGLVEQLDSGTFYMTDIELMIGQSSTEAERKRAARLENKALLPPRTKGGHLSDIRPPEIEIKKEIDIEIEKERELETGQAPARSYIVIIPYRSEIVEIFDFGAVFLLSGHTGKGSKMSYD